MPCASFVGQLVPPSARAAEAGGQRWRLQGGAAIITDLLAFFGGGRKTGLTIYWGGARAWETLRGPTATR